MGRVDEVNQQLQQIITDLNQVKSKSNYNENDVLPLQKKLHAIDKKWNEGAIKEDDGSVSPGQAGLSDLINEAHELVEGLLDGLPEGADE
ncbi:hypothetical protein HK097_000200 [Rhizophlyctis rosea]|uniref:Uncharacterized protein n=1 Tax=Rhizophlyctis rosea TaxID=64517 RepID=A0AAD5X736_9FUNG|nr:hypothetical protein HK097_000200 [Rhizophlyctis rosea]